MDAGHEGFQQKMPREKSRGVFVFALLKI